MQSGSSGSACLPRLSVHHEFLLTEDKYLHAGVFEESILLGRSVSTARQDCGGSYNRSGMALVDCCHAFSMQLVEFPKFLMQLVEFRNRSDKSLFSLIICFRFLMICRSTSFIFSRLTSLLQPHLALFYSVSVYLEGCI